MIEHSEPRTRLVTQEAIDAGLKQARRERAAAFKQAGHALRRAVGRLAGRA